MNSHRRTLEHKTNSCVLLADGVHLIRSAFKFRIIGYRSHSENFHIHYTLFFNEVKQKALNLLEEHIDGVTTKRLKCCECLLRLFVMTPSTSYSKSIKLARLT
ncbi:hypothetical protein NQ317_012932 [Molorchus minor]|uniref:Uncharacterized protein n=1 Tax=Molorchus minor TaxID=1323400 RepID=A0ABQ9IRE8_9CUCU|nr:hypothetical protein NQ317_012932 [Molorchus minor]